MPETFLILGANSFYGSNFARLVEERGDVAIRSRHYELLSAADYVVNFASKSQVAESWEDPEAWVEANAGVFALMLDELKEWDFTKFVHVSTPEVYGSVPYWIEES